MDQHGFEFNTDVTRGGPPTAPTRNITLMASLIKRALDAPAHLPRMVCMSGPSGFGKSFATSWANSRFQGYYVEARSTWTRRSMLVTIAGDMGLETRGTVDDLRNRVCEQLTTCRKPLFLDEMDHVVERGLVELVRDIYEGSGRGIVVLIGEEQLPKKLERYERFHGRMLGWAQAQPADLADARALATLYCRNVTIADDLLQKLIDATGGSARRICVNLDSMATLARGKSLKELTLADWGNRQIFTGAAPAARSFRL